MKRFAVIVTSELASPVNNFIISTCTNVFENFDDAVAYGRECCKQVAEYPALADFYIYELIAQSDVLGDRHE